MGLVDGEVSGKRPVRRVLEWLGIVRPANEVRMLPPWVYVTLAAFNLAVGGMVLFQEEFRLRLGGAFLVVVGVPGMVFLALRSHRKREEGPPA